MVGLVPGFVVIWSDLFSYIHSHWPALPLFFYGLFAYALVWFFVFRSRLVGSAFSTFEHELTHAVFAWLTLHRISGIRVTWNSGGHIRIHGGINWLILVAPYCVPTLALVFVPIYFWLPDWVTPITQLLFGCLVGYHICSTWLALHPGQSDLKEVGWFFSMLWIPSANLAVFAILLLVALDAPLSVHLAHAFDFSQSWWLHLWERIDWP